LSFSSRRPKHWRDPWKSRNRLHGGDWPLPALQGLTGLERLQAGAELLAQIYDVASRLEAICLEVRGAIELTTPVP